VGSIKARSLPSQLATATSSRRHPKAWNRRRIGLPGLRFRGEDRLSITPFLSPADGEPGEISAQGATGEKNRRSPLSKQWKKSGTWIAP
jgi:hypothetical protein